ncbi:MAG: ABC transporter permease [Acidobacteriia bacterium]|nr:ABC transporter permease [Terriglobia bacterium]
MSASAFFDGMGNHVKFALRTMRKNFAFSTFVVLVMALGIGANTAMFSVISNVLLKPLGYQDPDRLVLVTRSATPIRYEEFLAANRSYSGMGAYTVALQNVTLSGVEQPEVLKSSRVSANFLEILGVSPLAGRSFRPEEDKAGALPVAMISADLWERRFGRDPQVVGKTVTLAGTSYSIIGVLPVGFQFPFAGADVWLTRPQDWPVVPDATRRISPILALFGRLKPGITMQQANAELQVLNEHYRTAHSGLLDAKSDSPEPVTALKDDLVSGIRLELWMLFGALAFVLMIVCANVGSLLLVRASSRSREFAVRAAIGAGRGTIIGQLLVEGILLSLIGGIAGMGLAVGALNALQSLTYIDLPRIHEIHVDLGVLGFAAALSIFTGVLFGLMPALTASRPDLARVLRANGEQARAASSRSARWFGIKGLLVIGQIAVSIMLLIGATLLIESALRLHQVNLGFQPENLLTMRIALSPAHYQQAEAKAAYYKEMVSRTEALPGVQSAAVALTVPMSGFVASPVQLIGSRSIRQDESPIAILQNVTPDYFRALQISLKRGREFTEHDEAKSVPVAIINESMARAFSPEYPGGLDLIGQHVTVGTNSQSIEIVGIAADVRQSGRDAEPRPELYLPCAQTPPSSAMLAVRMKGDPLSIANSIRQVALTLDRDQPVAAVSTMDSLIEAAEGQRRLVMELLGVFAASATLLAIIGLYGVISYTVVQRTTEIGIRRALGAPTSNLLLLVVGHGLALSLMGIVIGIIAAVLLNRVIESFLFNVKATDPLTFFAVAVLFTFVSALASYLPARRAAQIDPLTAIRVG